MRTLIIGGTGNISTAIVRQLCDSDNEVVLYNRGRSRGEWNERKNVRVIHGDRNHYAEFEEQLKEQRFDCVIDMIGYKIEDAQSDLRAFAGKCEQFIFCSTVDVFTKPAPNYPVTERTEKKPAAAFPYAFQKAAMEAEFERAAENGAFALTIVRPAATYNDTSAPIGIMNSGLAVMRRIRHGRPVILMGDGMSLWASAHRDDVGKAIAEAVLNRKTYGRSYNIPGTECMTWKNYYGTVANAMGVNQPEFVTIPTDVLFAAAPSACSWCPINFMYNNIFEFDAAVRDLGFRYTITWLEGVSRMIAYHDKLGNIDGSQDHPAYDPLIRLCVEFREKAGALANLDSVSRK
ncbi:MAG: NAD-dependent epimerase/dehydratase family protein [Firmicutes bacterium]|nr:NAD-dependent epimerase/dehydratase family protein [Bacillota bacterium]